MSNDPSETILRRASMLLEQRRYSAAQSELRQVLAENPEHTYAHALLSLALAQDERVGDAARTPEHREQLIESTRHAESAIASDPNDSLGFYALAFSRLQRGDCPAAIEAGQTAIALDPYDADSYAIVAGAQLQSRHYAEALETAEQGLKVDPEHGSCTNIRSLALERLGRGGEAIVAAQAQLSRQPDDSTAHAAVAYAHLNQGEYKEAQLAFREALRLDPTDEFARRGMIEAINSSNFFYRILHRYFVWMGRLDQRVAFALMIGFYLLIQNIDRLADAVPFLAPYTSVIVMGYVIFALTTWIASPLMNTALRLHPFGRHLLNGKERLTSTLIAILMGCALLSLAAGLIWFNLTYAMAGVMYCFLLSVFVVATMNMPTRAGRIGIGIASAVVAILPFAGMFLYFVYGSLAIQLGSQMLAARSRAF
tara:strand:+ start:1750 stop:3024 length:1275 start_codon:yes stop_codon:yes gene_type:complete